MLPLEGLIVADFSHWYPGPYCARLLSDMGARVIKIEPISGDQERNVPGTFSVVNAGKESVAVDLTSGEGREFIYRLLNQADIFIESFRPGITAKLGIDYDTVKKAKEDIIYCSITGYGQTGPLSSLPAHNISINAESGVLGMGGLTGEPPEDTFGIFAGDLSAAMFAVISVLGAVLQRDREGKGSYIDISMSDCLVSWVSGVWGEYDIGLTKEEVICHPAYGVFEAKDGKYMAIAAIVDKHWQALCETLELRDWLEDPAFGERNKRKPLAGIINKRIAETIKTKERDYWLSVLRGVGVAANPVNTPEELAVHEHFMARQLLNPSMKMRPSAGVAFPALINNQRWGRERPAAPSLGQDTRAVMKSMGYSDKEIADLAENGIITICL